MIEAAARATSASDLPRRWQGGERFVMLGTGARVAAAFLAAWSAWREDPLRCGHLHFIALDWPADGDALRGAVLDRLQATGPPTASGAAIATLLGTLRDSLPPLTPGLHRIAYEDGRVQLLLSTRVAPTALREIVADVDAYVLTEDAQSGRCFLDDFPRSASSMGRLASPSSTVVATTLSASALDS
ncbi:MAG: hypothetical protein ABIV63_07690, partial [Caldimonas sp.]